MIAPSYSYRASALHAARAGVTTAFCAALCVPALLYESPVVLVAALGATVLAGVAAGVGSRLSAAVRLGVPVAIVFMVVNALVSREGTTLLVRGGDLLGRRLDVTLEAVAYGGVAGLRVLVLLLALALYSATVDPDETLRLFRRISYRSALTASLATRLVPVMARDAARMRQAAACRSARPGRGAATRAALRGSLDRAVDVAASLELRGYAGARGTKQAPIRVPWSRHDMRVAGAAVALAAVTVGGRLAGAGGFEAYPALELELGPLDAALALVLPLLALVPFAGAAARLGVARA